MKGEKPDLNLIPGEGEGNANEGEEPDLKVLGRSIDEECLLRSITRRPSHEDGYPDDFPPAS